MTNLGRASAVAACLPAGVLDEILDIWEGREDKSVVMHFKDGRCLRMEATDIKQYGKDDFSEGGAG